MLRLFIKSLREYDTNMEPEDSIIPTPAPTSLWDQIIHGDELFSLDRYPRSELPKVTIIIPTCNAAHLISFTLEKVLTQNYPDFEVIIVDCSSDRTLEVVRTFHSDKIRIYSIDMCTRYTMVNKGIAQAQGKYINILFPGDFYIYHETLLTMMTLALKEEKPQMVYCGTLLRDIKSDAKILYRKLDLKLLKKGMQPTSLQSCWFRLDALRRIGKFDSNYELRGGFDLMCRLVLHSENFKFASVNRIYIDYDLRAVTRQMVLTHFSETIKIIYKHFGFFASLRWFFVQKDVKRFFTLWLESLKIAFSGR